MKKQMEMDLFALLDAMAMKAAAREYQYLTAKEKYLNDGYNFRECDKKAGWQKESFYSYRSKAYGIILALHTLGLVDDVNSYFSSTIEEKRRAIDVDKKEKEVNGKQFHAAMYGKVTA